MATTGLRVTGMSCSHCERAVAEALERVAGVTKARVSLEAGRADVEHDAAVAATTLVAAVREEGYEAEPEAG